MALNDWQEAVTRPLGSSGLVVFGDHVREMAFLCSSAESGTGRAAASSPTWILAPELGPDASGGADGVVSGCHLMEPGVGTGFDFPSPRFSGRKV